MHYLAIASCAEIVQPDTIMVHCHELPYGFYWDLARPLVELHRVEPVPEVIEFPYDDPVVRHYSYAHQADFVRLDVLAEHGGLYADIDTLFVAPLAGCAVGRAVRDRPGSRRVRSAHRSFAPVGVERVGHGRARRAVRRALARRDRGRARRLVERAQLLPRRRPRPRAFPTTCGSSRSARSTRSRRPPTASAVSWSSARPTSPASSRSTSPPTCGGRRPGATSARCTPARSTSAGSAPGATTYARRGTALPPRSRVLLRWRRRGAALRRRGRATGYGDAADRLVRATRAHGTAVEYRGWSNTRAGAEPALVRFSRDPLPREDARRRARRPSRTSCPSTTRSCARWSPDGPFVAHTVWESDRLPAALARAARRHRPRDRADRVEPRRVRRPAGCTRRWRSCPTSATAVEPGRPRGRRSGSPPTTSSSTRSAAGTSARRCSSPCGRTSTRSPPTTRSCWW